MPHHFASSVKALALCIATSLLTQCAAPVYVKTVKPEPPAGATTTPSALGGLLDSIRGSYGRISNGDNTAIPAYNFAVARLIEKIKHSGVDPWSSPLGVSGSSDTRLLIGRCPAQITPLRDQLLPTDTLSFQGEDSQYQSIVAGIGAPLVAVNSFAHLGHEQFRKDLPIRNLSAIVRFEKGTATLELMDPYQVESVTLAGHRHPLAADYGAAGMLALSKARVDKLGIVRLLRPARYVDTMHLNFLQPYDPARIPVLMVHGLDSTPVTFAPMYFKLLEDPEIRRRYQFWVFSYPSGYPYPYTATFLRRELDKVRMEFPNHKDVVIIGHSMGTLISRLMVTDADEKIWRGVFGKPVAQTPITGSSRDLLVECLVFRNRPEIHRAIFISGPHRGSDLASDWIGRIGSRLVRLPGFVADVRDTLVSVATIDTAALHLARAPNSIDMLAPDNPFVREINKIPIARGVTYHSIVGDRGRGDTPNSSDGVVPYWSSHLGGAASERIVPSGHPAHQHPQGIEEVHRILLLHLRNAR